MHTPTLSQHQTPDWLEQHAALDAQPTLCSSSAHIPRASSCLLPEHGRRGLFSKHHFTSPCHPALSPRPHPYAWAACTQKFSLHDAAVGPARRRTLQPVLQCSTLMLHSPLQRCLQRGSGICACAHIFQGAKRSSSSSLRATRHPANATGRSSGSLAALRPGSQGMARAAAAAGWLQGLLARVAATAGRQLPTPRLRAQ
jgi:hypothetical protein